MNKKYLKNQNKRYPINLTEEQIAIIKAGLQFYWLADDYGYALWGAMPGVFLGNSDLYYRRSVGELYENLKKLSNVKPDYGWWGNIERISELCQKDYLVVKKEGEEAEKAMYEEYLLHETIKTTFDKHGLNGEEISTEILKEFNKKKNESNSSKKVTKKNKK